MSKMLSFGLECIVKSIEGGKAMVNIRRSLIIRIFSLLLIVLLFLSSISVITYADDSIYFDASDWAKKEIENASKNGVLPPMLKGKDMTKPATREELCELVVLLYEKLDGNKVPIPESNPFTDTTNVQIMKAYSLGITTGTTPTTFEPNAITNREQLAVMFGRGMQKLYPNLNYSGIGAPNFSDKSDISSWALSYVLFMSKEGILKGDAEKFMPKAITDTQRLSGYGTTTREQAIAITERIHSKHQEYEVEDAIKEKEPEEEKIEEPIEEPIEESEIIEVEEEGLENKPLTLEKIPDSVKIISDTSFLRYNLSLATAPGPIMTAQEATVAGFVWKGNTIVKYVGNDTEVDIPSKIDDVVITKIDYIAMLDKKLKLVTIPDSIITIKEGAFNDNPDLVIEVDFRNENFMSFKGGLYTKDGKTLLSGSKTVANNIKDGVEIIGREAFTSNELTSVTIPSSVTTIDNYAFNMNQLVAVTIPNSVKTIGIFAFNNNQLQTVSIGDSLISIREGAFSFNPDLKITIDKNNPYYSSSFDGAVYTKDGTYALVFGNRFMSDQISNGTTYIEKYAFSGNNISSVTIPNTVITIGAGAFSNNQLTSVIIPDSVDSIGYGAFGYNYISLVKIGSSVKTIENMAFSRNGLKQNSNNITDQPYSGTWELVGDLKDWSKK